MYTHSHSTVSDTTHLTPYKHRAKHHLQTVEEVVADDDDCGAAGCPALARTYRFYARRRYGERGIQTYQTSDNTEIINNSQNK